MITLYVNKNSIERVPATLRKVPKEGGDQSLYHTSCRHVYILESSIDLCLIGDSGITMCDVIGYASHEYAFAFLNCLSRLQPKQLKRYFDVYCVKTICADSERTDPFVKIKAIFRMMLTGASKGEAYKDIITLLLHTIEKVSVR